MTINIDNFRKELKYSANQPPLIIVEELNQIRIFNNQVEEQAKSLTKKAILSGILLFVSFFLVSVGIGFLRFVPALIATVYFGFKAHKYGALKMSSYRYQIPKKLAYLLNRDLAENANLQVKIDFTQPILKNKLISKADHPLRSGWKLKNYQDPWLNIQGEFCDRTQFKLAVEENHRNASGWKTSSSGKRKHKSKTKFKGSEITLKLRYSAKKYGAIQIIQEDAAEAIQLPKFAQLKSLKINSRSILLRVGLPHKGIDKIYQTVTAMFLSLYQILNLARTLSKANN